MTETQYGTAWAVQVTYYDEDGGPLTTTTPRCPRTLRPGRTSTTTPSCPPRVGAGLRERPASPRIVSTTIFGPGLTFPSGDCKITDPNLLLDDQAREALDRLDHHDQD